MPKGNKVKSNDPANLAKVPELEVTAAIERNKSARDLIRSALLKRRSEGVYLPGERLKEMSLAHEFQVSQAPVREAFRELETLGLLVSEHYRGTRVRGISSQEFRDAYQLRGYLEEIAAQLIPPAKLKDAIGCAESLQATMRAAALKGDPDRFARANTQFHRSIVGLASNQVLLKVWDSLEIGMLSRLNLQKNETKLRSLAEIHQPIVDSLKRQDLKRTGALLREHAFSFLQDLP